MPLAKNPAHVSVGAHADHDHLGYRCGLVGQDASAGGPSKALAMVRVPLRAQPSWKLLRKCQCPVSGCGNDR